MSPGELPSRVLEAKGPDIVRRRTDEGDPGRLAGLGKGGVLGQEAVAGVDRLRPCRPGGGQHSLDVQVTFAGRCRADAHRLVSFPDVGRAGVGVGEHRNGCHPHAAQGADDPAGDGAAVSDQDLVEHGLTPRWRR